MALSAATTEAVWLRSLFSEVYGAALIPPTTIFEDNDGARALADNHRFSEKTKHVARKEFFVREKVQEKTIVVWRYSAKKMLADIFTKPLCRQTFTALVAKIQSGRVRPQDPDF